MGTVFTCVDMQLNQPNTAWRRKSKSVGIWPTTRLSFLPTFAGAIYLMFFGVPSVATGPGEAELGRST